MPKNAKKDVYKKKEFDLYVIWKFLPAYFRGIKKNELKSLGFTNPLILKIIKIKNQTEFAKYFQIKDLGTLTDWNNKIKKENITSPLSTTDFQKQLTNINEQIVLPNINKLKKENSLLKEKLKLRKSTKKRSRSTKNIFQKIKNAFLK